MGSGKAGGPKTGRAWITHVQPQPPPPSAEDFPLAHFINAFLLSFLEQKTLYKIQANNIIAVFINSW